MRKILGLCGISLLLLAICVGCGSKKQEASDAAKPAEATADAPKADEAKADEAKADAPKADEVKADEAKADEAKADEAKPAEPAKYELTAPKRLHISDLKELAPHVHVDNMEGITEPNIDKKTEPDYDFPAMYNHNNGENEEDGSLWAECKGTFAGKAKDFSDALTKADVIGPVVFTKNVTIDDIKTTDDGTTYVMRVGKGEGFNDAFDMGVTIDTIYDKKDRLVGWRYQGKKVGGSEAVAKADLDILIYQMDANNCHIEYRNVVKGASFNAEGLVKNEDVLFEHWTKISKTFVDELE